MTVGRSALEDTGPLRPVPRDGAAHRGPAPHGGPVPRQVEAPRPQPGRTQRGRRRLRGEGRGGVGVLVAAAVGSLVAVGLGVYGRLHEPTLVAVNIAGFSSGTAAKSWLASGAFLLALVQLWSAAALFGRLGRRRREAGPPRWVGGVHRWSGRAAVLLTVPVAVHCLYAFGYQDSTPRVLLHSLAGCFLYGAFVAKMLVLQRPRSPRWSLPLLGGALFTAITVVWLTSAGWFFTTTGLTF
jgi:hypothetical protein